jgi:UDP-N-acetylglucosamine 2-epimerase (non-hydrolysing)
MKKPKILCVVGARPNFMKIAPIMAALRKVVPTFEEKLVHTGQHYDVAMNEQFFEQLGIPKPDISLEVGSGSHAVQTAEIMKRFESVIETEQPDAVLVVGDVNSTIACALVAAKMKVKVIHVEAGLRSRDRSMPEEINRVLTDQLSDRLYTTERSALANLVAEGVAEDRVIFAGNVMIDTLMANRDKAIPVEVTLQGAPQLELFLKNKNGYCVLTLHRPSNVDDSVVLERLLKTVAEISWNLPVLFPVHPRTKGKIHDLGLLPLLDTPNIFLLPPLGYMEMLGLMREARLVLTDSGGIQEETTALGVPCLTLRDNTERPITVDQGTNTLVGTQPEAIKIAVRTILTNGGKAGRVPEFWDGHAAERIVRDLDTWLETSI